jgi:mRNA interferase RelE/StbE
VAKYRILIKPSAVKDIEAIPLKKDRRRIVDRISKLAENPRPLGCEKLSGQDKYRLPQGRYRIVYSIEDKDLVVYVV